MTLEQAGAMLLATAMTYRNHALTILGLILIDLALGALSGWKMGTFKLTRVGDFYRKQVVPTLGGWLVITLGLPLITTDLVPGFAQAINATAAWGLFVLACTDLLGSIVKSYTELRGTNGASS